MCEPVGCVEVAARLGVKRQTVAQWRVRGVMPAPAWTVSGQPCWDWSTVEAWALRTGRLTISHSPDVTIAVEPPNLLSAPSHHR